MRVAIICPFASFDPTYSLVHVATDQVRGLLLHGVKPTLLALSNSVLTSDATIDIVPYMKTWFHPFDHGSERATPEQSSLLMADFERMENELKPDLVITHDCLFQEAYTPMARAIHEYAPISKAVWFHWCHSYVSEHTQPITEYSIWRRTLPKGKHYLVYPSVSLQGNLAAHYDTSVDRVLYCPNPRDPCAAMHAHPFTRSLVYNRHMLERDVVQVYPFCMTRWRDKGVDHLLRIFDEIKAQGNSVSLILCNANASGDREQSSISELKKIPKHLTSDDYVFTSEFRPDWINGVPNRVVSQAMAFSNTFLLPSHAEVSPLTLLEAANAGCVLGGNTLVPSIREHLPSVGLQFQFLPPHTDVRNYLVYARSGRHTKSVGGEAAYNLTVKGIASRVAHAVRANPSIVTKRLTWNSHSAGAAARELLKKYETVKRNGDYSVKA